MLDATGFAEDWEAAWNSHDIDRIMAHFRPDIIFRSKKALALTGKGEVRGTAALRAYCAGASALQPDLKFTVLNVFAGHEMLVIT